MTITPASHPGHSALRRGRVSLDGQIYLITFATLQRQILFADHAVARVAALAFVDPRAWRRSDLLAWVLMPDHWHGLIQLGNGEQLSALVGALKSNTSHKLRSIFPGLGCIWAKAFHDRALRRDEDLLSAARYVILNPVRAGLVARVGDYPYWNAIWL